MALDAEVVIVGAGPVGLGLAVELGQRQVRCALLERLREPAPIPKGQNLTHRTLEHFHFWGAERELRAARTIPPAWGIGGLTAYGTLLGGYHYDWLQRELVAPYYFCANERLPQYATEAVLRRRLEALPAVQTLYGWQADGMGQDEHGVRVLASECGGTGRLALRGAYAVGCDGSGSMVRERAGIRSTRRDHERRMVLLVFRSRRLHELTARFAGKSFFKVLHPALEGYWQFLGRVDLDATWFFHAPVGPEVTASTDFRGVLQAVVGAELDVELEHVGFWNLRVAVADSYRAGRIFIAGDAAHSHPPYGGYGVNTGFEDAKNLGWKLAARLQGWGSETLLESYTAERRPVFESIAVDFIERAIERDRRFLQLHRPERDAAAFEQAWAARAAEAREEVAGFEPNYEGSPLVSPSGKERPSAIGTHSFTARAGHHLSPCVLRSGRNVFEELSDGFTMLALDSAPHGVAAFQAAAQALGVPLRTVDNFSDEARERYGAPLVLVRPDQFVAWAGTADEGTAARVLARAAGLGADANAL